jgi:hypothetical protein
MSKNSISEGAPGHARGSDEERRCAIGAVAVGGESLPPAAAPLPLPPAGHHCCRPCPPPNAGQEQDPLARWHRQLQDLRLVYSYKKNYLIEDNRKVVFNFLIFWGFHLAGLESFGHSLAYLLDAEGLLYRT